MFSYKHITILFFHTIVQLETLNIANSGASCRVCRMILHQAQGPFFFALRISQKTNQLSSSASKFSVMKSIIL